MAARRTERLMNLLIALLNTRQGRSKEYLRANIAEYRESVSTEAFERMFERDKVDLRSLGIPLESRTEGGAFEGDLATTIYRIPKDKYRLERIQFSAAESAALNVATRLWNQASVGSEATAALRKLKSTGDVSGVPPLAEAGAVQPQVSAREPAFAPLLEALALQSTVTFDYQGGKDSAPLTRRVSPWGLGQKFGYWYLVGYDLDKRAERIFRLWRIASAPILGEPSEHRRPDGFSLQDRLDSMVVPALEQATVLIASRAALALRENATAAPESPWQEPGWDAYTLPVHTTAVTAARLASFGASVRVIQPAHVRDAVVRLLTVAAQRQGMPVPSGHAPQALAAVRAKPSSSQDRLRRLIDLVPFLTHHQGIHMDDLAAEFGISRAQLEKDLELLIVTGLPGGMHGDLMDVQCEDGHVYIADAEDLSEPIRLSIVEAASLLVGLEALAALPGVGEENAVRTAIAKISAAAATAVPGLQDEITRGVDVQLQDRGPHWDAITSALAEHRSLHMDYLVPHRDEISTRVVDPIRLFSEKGSWYLQAFCHSADAQRTFRLDRITAVSPGAHVQSRTALADFPERLFTPAQGQTEVRVAVAEEARWFLDDYFAHIDEELDDAGSPWRYRAHLSVGEPGWLPSMVASTGGLVRVIAPAQVAQECGDWLARALAVQGSGEEFLPAAPGL